MVQVERERKGERKTLWSGRNLARLTGERLQLGFKAPEMACKWPLVAIML